MSVKSCCIENNPQTQWLKTVNSYYCLHIYTSTGDSADLGQADLDWLHSRARGQLVGSCGNHNSYDRPCSSHPLAGHLRPFTAMPSPIKGGIG